MFGSCLRVSLPNATFVLRAGLINMIFIHFGLLFAELFKFLFSMALIAKRGEWHLFGNVTWRSNLPYLIPALLFAIDNNSVFGKGVDVFCVCGLFVAVVDSHARKFNDFVFVLLLSDSTIH